MKIRNLILIAAALPLAATGQPKTDSLFKELSSTGLDTNRVKILDQLSFAYCRINPDSGLKYGAQAKVLAETLQWPKGIAVAYSDIAVNYEAKSEHALAIENHTKALTVYRQLKAQSSIACVLSNISVVYENEGDYPNALSYAYDALSICEDIADTATAAVIWESTGRIYMRQKIYPTAMLHYSTALAMHRKIGNKVGEARVLGNIGILQDTYGHYNEALDFQMQALEVNRKQNDITGQQVNFMNIGIVYCHMKDYDNALKFQYRALRMSEESGRTGDIAVNNGNIGETYYYSALEDSSAAAKNIQLQSAISFLERSVNQCRSIQYYMPMVEFGQLLSEAYALRGENDKAFRLLKEINTIKDSLAAHDQLLKLHDIETKRELALQEKQLVIQGNQLQIAQLTEANELAERNLYLAGIAFLLLIGGYIFIRYWQKIRNQEAALSDIAFIQSHELRGPVARILGLIQLLNAEQPEYPDKKVLNYIQQSGAELDEVIRKVVKHSTDNIPKRESRVRRIRYAIKSLSRSR